MTKMDRLMSGFPQLRLQGYDIAESKKRASIPPQEERKDVRVHKVVADLKPEDSDPSEESARQEDKEDSDLEYTNMEHSPGLDSPTVHNELRFIMEDPTCTCSIRACNYTIMATRNVCMDEIQLPNTQENSSYARSEQNRPIVSVYN